MLCFLNVGHVTVGEVTLDVFPKASNGKNAWIGFTLGLILSMLAVTQR